MILQTKNGSHISINQGQLLCRFVMIVDQNTQVQSLHTVLKSIERKISLQTAHVKAFGGLFRGNNSIDL